ncbi:MAG: hypothetical protein IPK00_02870 [Deltaproteobacteria bacterium]|nr:hypothetical protein [Deltaproteobacteria bacterium]
MAEDHETGTKEGAAGTALDASLRVDPRTLPSADQDFARMMGFGDEPADAAATTASTPMPRVALDEPPAHVHDESIASEEPISIAEASSEERPVEPEDSEAAPVGTGEALSPLPAREWDEIHPRAATLGRQSALIERAERVLALPPVLAASPAVAQTEGASLFLAQPGEDPSGQERLRASESRIAALETERRALEEALVHARQQAAVRPAAPTSSPSPLPTDELEKELERLRGELDGLLLERDRLGDELSVARAARAEANARAERLEAAYRSARGPHGPVPEGERELRAEVVGLRRRLEESGAESRRLRDALDASATELAIARAHADDRQQELEQQRDQIAALERDRAAQIERLDESLARQRELLALVSRVQAENVELRSTQAALEETLEARDLEISAREEHLLVTRRGLAARDAQLVDAEERLEQERHRRELVETELERARLAHAELAEGLTRRDARIATLSTTLARVEDAIGRSLPPAMPRADEAAAPTPPARSTTSADAEVTSAGPDAANAPETTRGASPISQDDPIPADMAALSEPPNAGVRLPALPLILAGWRDAGLATACGPEQGASVADFLARRLAACAATHATTRVHVASLGGARIESEIELVRAYRALGAGEIMIDVLERSAEAGELRRSAIDAAGLTDTIRILAWADADQALATKPIAVLLADAFAWDAAATPDALPAASLLDRMGSALAENGIALWVGRLAGGSVSLSETTNEKLAELWQVLPEAWTGRPGFEMPPGPGDAGGTPACSPDPLAALLDRFRPIVKVGLGHIADLFLGPARGFALSEEGPSAESLLASIDAIDESRSILESLPARHGVAVLVPRTDATPDAEDPTAESLGLAWPEPLR